MRGMSWPGTGKATVVIRSHRLAARLSPLRTVSWTVSPRAVRRGGLSMIALAAVAALTRRRPVWYISLVIGVIGLVLFSYGFLMHPG